MIMKFDGGGDDNDGSHMIYSTSTGDSLIAEYNSGKFDLQDFYCFI
jgi:hypothetical protein